MAIWGVSRVFRKVSAGDFRAAVTALHDGLQNHGKDPVYMEIGFYRRASSSLFSIVDSDGGGMLKRLNPVLQFQSVANPRDISEELWEEADYVDAVLKAVDGSDVIGHVEAKGLKPRQITFNVSPDDPGEAIKDEEMDYFKWWRTSDGVNTNRFAYTHL